MCLRVHTLTSTMRATNVCMEVHMIIETMLTPMPMDPDDACECVHPSAVIDARRVLGDVPSVEGVAEIFAILGDPTRVRVLTALRAGELCVSDLAVATGVNRTTVSHQLRVLRSHR